MTPKLSALVTINDLLQPLIDIFNGVLCRPKPMPRKTIILLMTCKLRNILSDSDYTANQLKPQLCDTCTRNIRDPDAHYRMRAICHAACYTSNHNRRWRPFIQSTSVPHPRNNQLSNSQQLPRRITICLAAREVAVLFLSINHPYRHKDRADRPNRLNPTRHIPREPSSPHPVSNRTNNKPQPRSKDAKAPQCDQGSLNHYLPKRHTGLVFLAVKQLSLPAQAGHVHGGIAA